ncbi:MAG: M48 family metalloprotease [Hyphomicrobiaceae bacterium]|nr:M48 family metalloprotease [Hyphomicrobiaceae bacterium]
MSPFLDPKTLRAHKLRNTLHSLLLVGSLGLLTGFCGWLIWGAMGVAATLVAMGVLFAFAPRLPPELIMRFYRARRVDPGAGGRLLNVVDALSDRAELPVPPRVYVIPSMTLNAFASGTPDHAVIGITEGLLRRLNLNELAGVLAHEISHVRNDDLAIMGLADVMTRFTQALAYLALFVALFNLPVFLLGDAEIPLMGLGLLYLAPTLGNLIQLALSRTREFDADLEAASLTGDPASLASALQKLERYQGHFWEDMRLPVPGRRIPQPSLLRSHPRTEDRVARLEALRDRTLLPQLAVTEEPMASLFGAGPAAMRPRYRWTGVWF